MIHRAARFSCRAFALLLGVALAQCGGSESAGPDDQAPSALAPFVGTWDATSFVHTSKVDPSLVIDIVAEGTQFVLVIQGSGAYSATATLANVSQSEIGTLRVDANQLFLRAINPPAAEEPVTYTLSGNTMTWDGDSEWDFGSDGVSEITTVHIVFRRR